MKKVRVLERNHPLHIGEHSAKTALEREVPGFESVGRVSEGGLRIEGPLGGTENMAVDVGANDGAGGESVSIAARERMRVHQYRYRVGLLARRAARAPDAKLGIRSLPQLRNHPLLDDCVRVPVAEELRDVDRECPVQPVVFLQIRVENPGVLRIAVGSLRAHAHTNAAPQTLVLVAEAAESPITGNLFHQGAEFRVARL